MSRSARKRAEPKQLFLPIFRPHEVQAMNQVLKQRQAEKEKNREKYLKGLDTLKIKKPADTKTVDMWDLPLGEFEDVELSTVCDPYNETVDEEPPWSLSDEQAKVWSDEAIDLLHEGMVMYSLRLLNARGNGKEKKAILSWIFDPKPMAYDRSTDGDESPAWIFINASEVPFSFELCCRIVGYDPERIREGLAPILKELDLDELFKEVEDERNNDQGIRAEKVRHTLDIQYPRGAGKSGDSGSEGGAPRSAEDRSALRV
jgi:hypothetical protein